MKTILHKGTIFQFVILAQVGPVGETFLLSMVHSQEKMENKFERRSERTDLFLPLFVAAKNAQFSVFLFGSSWWRGKML